jgi:iron(III) transport system substrate-binding protein
MASRVPAGEEGPGRWFAGWCSGLLALGVLAAGCGEAKPRVVLYCAQDREFADELIRDFTAQTSLAVDPKFDTEANKSVSLYVELLHEKDRPRCDVHWNNEILSTLRLQRQGLLEPYDSPTTAPYPASAKAPDHTWHAFAARARILLVNTRLVPEARRPRSLLDLADPRWKGKVAMAKPQFGTTATQAACLFEVLGSEKARAFYLALKDNGVQVVPGNKQVAEGVGQGRFAVGLTDTDDAMAEVQAGNPVAIVFPDRDGHPHYPRMGTLYIPNTVAALRGCPNPVGARRMVDYLLGAGVEKKLAEGDSHQIPLNPEVKADLPRQIERPVGSGGTVRAMQVDFGKAADLWDEVQAFLIKEFAGP